MNSSLEYESIGKLLQHAAESTPEANAIAAPGRAPLTYGRLWTHVHELVATLNSTGIGRGDRVAIVLPNGPEMAVCFLAVAAGATSAPLNPAYRESDFEFYLKDLAANALVLPADSDSPARKVARDLGISVFELKCASDDPAGIFRLHSKQEAPAANGGFATADDVALVLHTSGTTSRPKMVPLSQSNICTSASNISATLTLSEKDRCLNVMPLFHIHGLIGAVLSSTMAGASVVCAPGFDSERFFPWLDEFEPSWYTAVPTMHQAVLAQAPANRHVIARRPMRLIRSSSSSLPPQVMQDLEKTFDVPVIESYGMTEASHQMTSNPLPPAHRKAGSVGLAAGPEVALMDEAGKLLPVSETGEIVIRGASVTAGYQNNPDANGAAFTGGWFRTGDQGHMDAEGYLYITGRLKEMINRGGENIAPREIDEIFLQHSDVMQATAFAVPHPTLGEDIAVAVVVNQENEITEKDLREYAFSKLADFKVPNRVVLVDKIPKGPTGKLQRIGLHEKLQQQLQVQFEAPDTELEIMVARFFGEVLDRESVGAGDNFFALGGDSLGATRVISRVRSECFVELPIETVFRTPTPRGLAAEIAHLMLSTDDKLLASALDEMEQLTDEQARALLEGG